MLVRFWRPLLALGGILIVVGGPMHPDGTMAEMLADPKWVPSHAWVLAGFVALSLALFGYWRGVARSATMRRWAGLAFCGTLFQTVEMGFHHFSYLDLANLQAGASTPILSAHLALAVVAYPLFALLMILAIIAGVRTGELGRAWFAPIGVVGVAAHGLAPVLVVTFAMEGARILFPMIMLFALWTLLTAWMPSRRQPG
jgi:hypothetical protein